MWIRNNDIFKNKKKDVIKKARITIIKKVILFKYEKANKNIKIDLNFINQ